jgi:hypothetical protein
LVTEGQNAASAWHRESAALSDNPATPGIASRLAALGPGPGPDGERARQSLVEYVFVWLVNNQNYQQANEVAAILGLRALIAAKAANGMKLTASADQDILFCLAVLDLQPNGNPERARAGFAALREMLPAGHHLLPSCDSGEAAAIRLALLATASAPDIAVTLAGLPSLPGPDGEAARRILIQDIFTTLVNRQDYALANDLAGKLDLRGLIETKCAGGGKLTEPHDLDTKFCLAVLDTQPGGDPERAGAGYAALRAMLPAGHHLYPSCDSGEASAIRGALLARAASPDIASELAALPPLPGPDGETARQVLIQDIFTVLVNQRDYTLANEIAVRLGLRTMLDAKCRAGLILAEPHDLNSLYALAVLDTQRGGDPERARAGFAALRAMLPPGHSLIPGCNEGEEVAIRLAALRKQTVIEAPRSGLAGFIRDPRKTTRNVNFADISIEPDQSRLPWLDRDDVDETSLTPEQIAWRRDGVLILRNFLPGSALGAYVARRAKLEKPSGWMSPTPYQHVPEMRALALYPPLMAIQKHLLGDDMMLHLALTGWISTERDWHQDDYLNPAFVMTRYTAIWMALDDISPDSGPFEYVPGSHRWPLISGDKVRKLLNPDEQGLKNWESRAERFMTPAIEAEILARGVKPVQFIANKGDVLIWHARLMHRGTPPRRTALERRSLIVHYSSVNCRPDMPNRATENGQAYALFDRPLY